MLKKGGPIKEYENIIPNGVLHEEENSLGDKGMPVVKCVSNVCTKKYEIEKEELIDGVTIGGVASFLERAEKSAMTLRF